MKKMKTKITLLIILLLLIANINSFSQISKGGTPISFKYHLDKAIPIIEMPSFDVNKCYEEDSINPTPYRFAKPFEVDLSIDNLGVWDTLQDGDRIWRLRIKSKDAYSLNVIFSVYELPEGAEVFIYNKDTTEVLGAFTSDNNSETNVLAVTPLSGDEIIIEYYEPSNIAFAGKLKIGQISHDYKGVFGKKKIKDGSYGQSGSCNIDINCETDATLQKIKRSVCRIIMGGAYLCSGALINNTSFDGTPYFLTANHCTGQPYNTWIFYFNYESPTCGGPDGSTSQTISGCSLIATTSNLDFCLVKMNNAPPSSYQPYYAGWDRTYLPQYCFGIHHPNGDVKKISYESEAPTIGSFDGIGYGYDQNTHWVIEWNYGITEGGSSGSPLFNEYGEIVGNLTGGYSSCSNLLGLDYYAMLYDSWDDYSSIYAQLKYWLDYAGTGADYINGYEPLSCTSPNATVNNVASPLPATMTCNASGGSGGSISYKWYGGTNCSGSVIGYNSSLQVSTSGNYSCKAYITGFEGTCYDCDFGYCSNTSGIDETLLNSPIYIYPNPAKNDINIDISLKAIIEIYNIQGQLLKIIVVNDKKTSVDISNFSSGMYFVKVKTEQGIAIKKFTKE